MAAQNSQAGYWRTLGGTGAAPAEKVAAEIGRLIGVDCAQIELARCVEQVVFGRPVHEGQEQGQAPRSEQNLLATISKSFLPVDYPSFSDIEPPAREYFFLHGWEILQDAVEGYDTDVKFGQRDHNVKNIVAAFLQLTGAGSSNPMPLWDDVLEKLASYALLDGLVGNTDRHHENWMLVYIQDRGDIMIDMMPSFDHASSLGRELTDAKRLRILESDGMLRYLQRGRGGVFLDSRRKRAHSPLRLARLLCRWRPDFMRGMLERIDSASDREIQASIGRVPPEFMSDLAKTFAYEVIITSKSELMRSVR